MFIGISGIIGVGKSTLTRELAEALHYDACFEPVETNPYLEDFYKDISRWTFNMQMFLLAKRFQMHQEIIWNPVHQKGGGVVQDRTIYEDTIFARMHRDDGLMSERDWNTYCSHWNIMRRYLVYPDVIIYLRVSPEVALKRVKDRGRDAEKGIELSYLEKLCEGYEEFVDEMHRFTTVYTMDWSDFRGLSQDRLVQMLQEVAAGEKYTRLLRKI